MGNSCKSVKQDEQYRNKTMADGKKGRMNVERSTADTKKKKSCLVTSVTDDSQSYERMQ